MRWFIFATTAWKTWDKWRKQDFIHHPEKYNRTPILYSIKEIYMQTKDHADDNEESQSGPIYVTPGNSGCLDRVWKKYHQKFNQSCEFMWQRPKSMWKMMTHCDLKTCLLGGIPFLQWQKTSQVKQTTWNHIPITVFQQWAWQSLIILALNPETWWLFQDTNQRLQ